MGWDVGAGCPLRAAGKGREIGIFIPQQETLIQDLGSLPVERTSGQVPETVKVAQRAHWVVEWLFIKAVGHRGGSRGNFISHVVMGFRSEEIT